MYRQFFAGMEYTGLALFAMALFLVLFVSMLVVVFALRRRRDYDPLASLPLDDAAPTSPSAPNEVNP